MTAIDPNAPTKPTDLTPQQEFGNAIRQAIIDTGIDLFRSDQMVKDIIETIKDEEAAKS